MIKSALSSTSELGSFHEHPQLQMFARLRKHMNNVQKKWGPLMAAKIDLDDEYNFPQGPYAGQGIPQKKFKHW
ncbi:hypothetical protein N7539_005662 [Penicillium diatomitis]|uniref:Uncharacterized protein n=1 Tax=Penicillium diatomitis TaxID=2819901 RepID=A0A9W9X7T5_9EURO|nr:uncharacterized protein N7539_005662 [Penicillium diatomitis]KAJ5485674.1 hypothetical protein N7539_005662 [Penicillium diatomitis]